MLPFRKGRGMYKILVVEDDDIICGEISRNLTKWGYLVECVRDFNGVYEEFMRFGPQLVLMDIGLPFYNGYYWCSEIRKVSQVPIIFVSSAGDNMNIVMAVNMGGDDFVAKPFDSQVLAAKVQAILRRTYAFCAKTSVMEYGGFLLNLSDGSLLSGEERIDLTKNEFRILQLLFENAGKTVCREDMMKRLWDNESFVDDNTLTVNITRLRRKLEDNQIRNLIQTKKGMGYLLGEWHG